MDRFRYWIDGGRLLRYDRESAGFPRGAFLGDDGAWRPTESPDRNIWRGSDCGEDITAAEARIFVAAHGYDSGILESTDLRPSHLWPQAHTVITVRLTRDSIAMGDDAWAPHEWDFPVNSITTLGELVEIIYAEPYLAQSSAGRSTWFIETLPPTRTALAVLTQERDRERWLVDPAEYLIQIPSVYAEQAERASLHLRHPSQNNADLVYATLVERFGAPATDYVARPNPAQRTQPERPRPPW